MPTARIGPGGPSISPGVRRRQVPRALLLAAAGAAVVALAYAFAPGDEEVVVAARRAPPPSRGAPPRSAEPTAASAAARPAIPLAPAGDPFVATSFVPPPPPAVAPPPPPPPPPPKAPPLPFTFVGLLESGAGKPAAFLARGEALLVVSAGETIDADYRVESLSPSEVVLTYLPLNERQKLAVTGARQ